MKLNTLVAAAFASVLLMGCQSTTTEVAKPSASKEIIEEAKAALQHHEAITVDDSGLISIVQTLPDRHYWKTSVVKKIGREVSCDDLRYFVDAGMVVSIHFQGSRGRYDQYDANRCLAEDQYL
ncbi:hypothetical protein [Vibrio sinaloensis]|uniref:hypothetical protein n=1 Tax=Photobacterium sp. (strain ATCC 43367) TaxID=379097 RepID=UPI0035EE2814